MPAIPKRITFNDDAYAWLRAMTKPNDYLPINSTPQEYAVNESKRQMYNTLEFQRNKQ